jgi:hypothetical protein
VSVLTYEEHKGISKALMCLKMFEWSVGRGYNSEQFVRAVMTSDWGIAVMTDKRSNEWSDALFLLSGFEEFCELQTGETYEELAMGFIGYLYKYWIDTYGVAPDEVYRIASPEKILSRYSYFELDNLGYDYIIRTFTDEIKEQEVV